MNLIKDLEEIAKENNIPIRNIMEDFNKKNKEIYNKQYGTFLENIKCRAIDSIKEDYKK